MQWYPMTTLPVYSDRIAQDFHLIPYYPRSHSCSLGAPKYCVSFMYNYVNKYVNSSFPKKSLLFSAILYIRIQTSISFSPLFAQV